MFDEVRKLSFLKLAGVELHLGKGVSSSSNENYFSWKSEDLHFDYLVLLDSRGASTNVEGGLNTVDLLTSYFEQKGVSYLIISRPLYLTVFPTLVSLCKNEDITYGNVITNVGFVDITPKKHLVLEDLKSQYLQFGYTFKKVYFKEYVLSGGIKERLSTFILDEKSSDDIVFYLSNLNSNFYFINTPLVQQISASDRHRPEEFFSQLEVTNSVLSDMATKVPGNIVDISNVGIETFDGLHYTPSEHQIVFNKLKECLELS